MSTAVTTGQKPGAPSAAYLRLAGMKPKRLEAMIVRGQAPDRDALVGREYRGMNLGPAPGLLGIRKFIKGFFRRDGQVFGYNVRVRQNRPEEPWLARLSGGERKRFGFFPVLPVDPEARDNAYLNALLLDYGRGGNPRFDITGTLRDYLVRVNPVSDDLLLGKAYIAIGSLRVPLGYFVLELQPDSDG